MAEKFGIYTIVTNPSLGRIINKYWHETGGKIQFISDCGHEGGFLNGIRQFMDMGAIAMYCQGGLADQLTNDGKFDEIAKGIELIRSNGIYPLGSVPTGLKLFQHLRQSTLKN